MKLRLPLLLMLVLIACGGTAAPLPSSSGVLLLDAPARITAGALLKVRIHGPQLLERAQVSLVAIGSIGVSTQQAQVSDGQATIVVTERMTAAAGLLLLEASAGSARGSTQLVIDPGSPVDPLPIFVGPRTVVADGRATSMAVTIPHDQYGNALADRTPVRIRLMMPDQHQIDLATAVHGGVAWQLIVGGFRAGRMLVSTTIADRHSLDADLMVTAGWPSSLSVEVEPASAPADARQLLTLRTTILRDRYGNRMPDGTMVVFAVTMPDGTAQSIPAYTIGGIAEAPLQAANEPGIAQVRVGMPGIVSPPQEIQFTAGPTIGTIPLMVTLDTTMSMLVVRAGPLIGAHDQLVANGTRVQFSVVDAAGHETQVVAESLAGVATAQFDLGSLGPGIAHIRSVSGDGHGTAEIGIP